MKRLLSLAALGILLTATGCGSGTESAPASYSTPEEAFSAFKKAGETEDWKGMAMVLTPESQDGMCAVMMIGAAFAGMTDEAAGKEVEAIMAKHGITEDSMSPEAKSPPIKDKPAFIADMMSFMSKHADDSEDGSDMGMPKGELTDLKIDGDSATAKVDDEPISFKKINGSWLIHMDELAEGMSPSGPAELDLGDPGDLDLGNPLESGAGGQ